MSLNLARDLVVMARHLVEAGGGLYSRLEYCQKQWPSSFEDVLHIALVKTGVAVGDVLEMEEPESYLKEHEAELSKSYPWDKYLGWIAKELNKELNSDDYGELVGFLLSRFDKFWEKVRKGGGVDIGKLNLRDVFDELGAISDLPLPSQGEIVQKFPDGWTLQKLITDKQLTDESERMRHCVKTYCQKVKDGTSIIFSLRDPKGLPHVTLEQDKDGKLVQIQASGNAFPKKHLNRLTEIVDTTFGGDYKGKFLLLAEAMNPVIWTLLNAGFSKEAFASNPNLSKAMKVPKDNETSQKLGFILIDWLFRVFLPLVFDSAGLKTEATKLRALETVVDKSTAATAFGTASDVARIAYRTSSTSSATAYDVAFKAIESTKNKDAAFIASKFFSVVNASGLPALLNRSKTLIQGSLLDLFDRMCEST